MCIKCGFINLSIKVDGLEPEVKRIAQLIYDGKLKPGQIDKAMVTKIADELMSGVFKGYGKSLSSDDLSLAERTFLNKVNDNVYVFSGFKNFQQLKETSLLLRDDDGKLKSFNDFLTDVKKVNETYNEVYLNAEYSNAVASGQTAASWDDYTNNGIDILTYRTAGDDKVREEHAILEGVTYPIDHEFWDIYYPPNDWGCRCDTEPAPGADPVSIAKGDRPELPEMFRNNVGKSGVLFPDTHPYFETNQADRKKILEQVNDIIPPDRSTVKHYNNDSGGAVEHEASVNKNELKENSSIAKLVADFGHKVKLLGVDNAPGVKNPDALIDGVPFEFKTNHKASVSAIDNELRRAKDQADHILLNIKSKISIEDLSNAISGRMSRSKKVESVWVIYNDKLIKLKRVEFLDRSKIAERIKKGEQH